jgi:hypothetical protein
MVRQLIEAEHRALRQEAAATSSPPSSCWTINGPSYRLKDHLADIRGMWAPGVITTVGDRHVHLYAKRHVDLTADSWAYLVS